MHPEIKQKSKHQSHGHQSSQIARVGKQPLYEQRNEKDQASNQQNSRRNGQQKKQRTEPEPRPWLRSAQLMRAALRTDLRRAGIRVLPGTEFHVIGPAAELAKQRPFAGGDPVTVVAIANHKFRKVNVCCRPQAATRSPPMGRLF
jgi:hypothetical protein